MKIQKLKTPVLKNWTTLPVSKPGQKAQYLKGAGPFFSLKLGDTMRNHDLVIEFNRHVLDIEQPSLGHQSDAEHKLSIAQLSEEIEEHIHAHNNKDFVGCIDSMVDLIYFAYGVLYKLGLDQEDIATIFAIVHTANMNKKRGVKESRAIEGTDRDAIKPVNWIAPEESIQLYVRNKEFNSGND